MSRTIVAPRLDSDFSKAGKLAYWKQILPQKLIHYTTPKGERATLDLNEAYLTDLANAHAAKVLDQTPFVLADADNRHTMDPERIRGEIAEMRLAREGEAPGLYAKIVFASKQAAKAVINNPGLGVSARIREGIDRADGSTVKRGIIHVLGTPDPQVTGMAPWVPAVDLSFDPTDNILDLSAESYEQEPDVAKPKTEPTAPAVPDALTVTDEQIDAMTEDELDAFLAEYAPGILTENAPEGEGAPTGEPVKELEPALSTQSSEDIQLANARAAEAHSRANEALKRAAAAEWREYRESALRDGVPPHLLDLAAPILNRPDEMVIDLSNTDDEDVNVAEILRGFVDAARGTVDLSAEQGHSGSATPGEDDPDKALLEAWDNQF